MNRADADRLWTHVKSLLRHPGPPEDHELRRAARMLASSRSDAVELLLAHWLAQARSPAAGLAEGPAPGSHQDAGKPPTASKRTEGDAGPIRAVSRSRLREAALVTAGVAGGALLAGLLIDDGVDVDLG